MIKKKHATENDTVGYNMAASVTVDHDADKKINYNSTHSGTQHHSPDYDTCKIIICYNPR